jgi:hypothetical protein
MKLAGIDDVIFSDSVKMCGYFGVLRGRVYRERLFVKMRALTEIGFNPLRTGLRPLRRL